MLWWGTRHSLCFGGNPPKSYGSWQESLFSRTSRWRSGVRAGPRCPEAFFAQNEREESPVTSSMSQQPRHVCHDLAVCSQFPANVQPIQNPKPGNRKGEIKSWLQALAEPLPWAFVSNKTPARKRFNRRNESNLEKPWRVLVGVQLLRHWANRKQTPTKTERYFSWVVH